MAKKNLLVTKEPGRAVWPHINEMDTKFDSDGVYHTKVAYPTTSAYAQSLVKDIDAALEEQAKKDAKGEKTKAKKGKTSPDLPYKVDEEKNEILFTFKLKAKGKTREGKEFTQKPMIFDAKGAKVDAKIGGGSSVNVSFEFYTWFSPKDGTGISLRMKAVQVVELRQYEGATADAYGFEQHEGGYEGEGSEFQQAKAEENPAETAAGPTSAPAGESKKSADF